jgi:hypothetical protein
MAVIHQHIKVTRGQSGKKSETKHMFPSVSGEGNFYEQLTFLHFLYTIIKSLTLYIYLYKFKTMVFITLRICSMQSGEFF